MLRLLRPSEYLRTQSNPTAEEAALVRKLLCRESKRLGKLVVIVVNRFITRLARRKSGSALITAV